MNSTIIAIFEDHLRIVAFVTSQLAIEIVGYLPKEKEMLLAKVINDLKINKPRVRVEEMNGDTLSVGLNSVDNNSPQFLVAICEELKIAGFNAKVIPEAIKDLLIYMTIKLTVDQREKVLPELINLPFDVEPEAINELQGILFEVDVKR